MITVGYWDQIYAGKRLIANQGKMKCAEIMR